MYYWPASFNSPMDNSIFQFILEKEKIEFALFTRSLKLSVWSDNLHAYLSSDLELHADLNISDLFSELEGYEDIFKEMITNETEPLVLDRIEKYTFSQKSPADLNCERDFYSLEVFPYCGQIMFILRDVSKEANLEKTIMQRRNELDLANVSLIKELRNANEELVQAYISTLEGWAHALELRDYETEGHSRRVVEMTRKMGRWMGIEEEDLKYYCYGALLHDIGKMGIPDSILKKPASLDEEEWEIMKQHPIFALDMLLPIKYLAKSLEIPYYHHEKWDGSGYPKGLKGEEIPLSARIFSIIDVYDALNSKRPYRKAQSKESTIQYLREQSGKQFDPKIVELFLSHIE